MTTVNLSGTWSEKTKPNNGLVKVADLVNRNRTVRVPIVGWIEFHQWTEKATGEVLTVVLPVVEAVVDADGKDSHGWGEAVEEMIDALRKERGLGASDDVPMHSGEMSGQQAFDFDGPDDGEPRQLGEVRMGPDGEHQVPPPSAEELEAEETERAEIAAKNKAEEKRARIKAERVQGESGVPAAEFSGSGK